MRHTRAIYVGVILASVWAATLEPQGAPAARSSQGRRLVVVMAEGLAEELARLAATSKSETVRCLIGVLVGDTVLMEIAWEPPIHESTPTHVSYAGCPRSSLAKWHNHLRETAATPEQGCYLSDIDIQDGLVAGAPLFQFVQVTAEVLCWWHRGQLQAADGQRVLAALPGQITVAGLATALPGNATEAVARRRN